jgi:integrase
MTTTFVEMKAWAVEAGESRDAIAEIDKVCRRLGYQDHDLGLIPVDLEYLERVIAPAPYAAVSTAANMDAAWRRGNSRLRALMGRYLATMAAAPAAPTRDTADWKAIVAYVRKNEGRPQDATPFPIGFAANLGMLAARADCASSAFDAAAAERIDETLDAERRKHLRRGIARLNALIAARNAHPEIAHLLPPTPVAAPTRKRTADRILWSELPGTLRELAETAFARATETPDDQAAEALARIAAGEDPEEVKAAFETQGSRSMTNRGAAREGYRQALAWALRSAMTMGVNPATVTDLREIIRIDVITAAIDAHLLRAKADARIKDPSRSQTLHGRLLNLRTLARYGLRDVGLATTIDLLMRSKRKVAPGPSRIGMTEETQVFLAQLIRTPSMATTVVHAPSRIAAEAERRLADAVEAKSEARELSALRLFASAAMHGLQLSRPCRTGNIQRTRVGAEGGRLHRIVWLKPGALAELKHPASEVKNSRIITLRAKGADAAILWRWQHELRPRYMALNKVAESAYLFPGTAAPRLLKDDVVLPRGCIAPSTLDAIWDDGQRVLGLAMTPHQVRHAVASLILAVRPGQYGLAAAVLGDTEETVRRHYGHEDGARAAEAVRTELLAAHPDLYKKLTRSLDHAAQTSDPHLGSTTA